MATLILSITHCNDQADKNPLLASFTTPHETPPFDKIETKDYEPAFDEAITEASEEIKAIASSSIPANFENTIIALDQAGEKLDTLSSIFFNLNSAYTNDAMQEIAQRVSPKLTAFSNSVYMNPQLFARVKQVYEAQDSLELTP